MTQLSHIEAWVKVLVLAYKSGPANQLVEVFLAMAANAMARASRRHKRAHFERDLDAANEYLDAAELAMQPMR